MASIEHIHRSTVRIKVALDVMSPVRVALAMLGIDEEHAAE